MRFKATVVMPGEPGETIKFELDDGDLDFECMALYQWLISGRSAGYTNSISTLHLFDCVTDDIAICGNWPASNGRAMHFATKGKKYKVCLKCRKKAEMMSPFS